MFSFGARFAFQSVRKSNAAVMVAETVQHLDVVAATDVHHNLTKALWAEEAASPAAAHSVAVASPGPRPGTNEDGQLPGSCSEPIPQKKTSANSTPEILGDSRSSLTLAAISAHKRLPL